MNTEVIKHDQQHQPSPFQRNQQLSAGANVGSVAIEQERAIAEAQGQLVLAKKFPRDENTSFAELMRACKVKAFADVAFYSVPRAGGAVSGPSIRMAEEIARVYGNFQYGHRELARDANKSEVEVFAWDMEKNNRSIRQITVFHVRDTKDGAKPLRDQKDIDDKIANVASKQVRGRILALMPKWLVEEAVQECRKTIAGNNDEPIEARVRKMTQAFAKYGVTPEHLERYLGHKLDQTLADEIVDLTGVFNAIKEGTPPSDFFAAEQQAEKSEQTAAAIADAAKSGAEAAQAASTTAGGPVAAAQAAKAAKAAKAAQKAEASKPAEAPVEKAQTESKPAEKVSKPTEEVAPAAVETMNQADDSADAGVAPGDVTEAEEDDVF